MNSELPILHHRGYIGILRINSKDRNRIYGSIAKEETPKVIILKDCYAGNNIEEVTEQFILFVNRDIDIAEYNERNREWRKHNDIKSIAAVYNILPKEFKTILESGIFDRNLLQKVEGGFYEVPLYYVTKAWDFILKSDMNGYEFMVGPYFGDEKPDISDWREFIIEDNPQRFRCQAIANNNSIKKLWRDFFDIDIDSLDIDFLKFNRHLVPNVSIDESHIFYRDVPDGVYEFIFDCINNPSIDYVFLDTVSDLMEAAADIKNSYIH